MAALDNFRINDPNFQNTADELANRAYWEGRDRGLSHLDALKAMEKGPMGLKRELLSVTGTKGDMHGYIGKSIRDSVLQYRPERLLPPPAQAAPALTPSHLTGPKMGSAPQPALQTSAPAEPKAALEHPKPYMHSAIANDPLLQLMAGGNKKRLGPVETYRFFKTLDPAVQEQHASRVDGSHLAKLEKREAMGGGDTVYGNLDATVTSESVQHESGDPIDALQDLYAAQNNAQSNPPRSYRNMSQGAQDARGALASVNTGTSGEPPVLAAGSGSNRLTNLLSGLSRDAIGFAKDVKQHGITLTWDGNTIFATDGENTVPVTKETAAAINDANNSSTEQDPTAITGPFMGGYGQDSLPPAPALKTQDESGTGNTAALTQPTQSTVRSTTGGHTGNARGSALPDMQIGFNERLMRMGAAGLAAGGQGSLAQMGAMFGASANVNQANRQGAMDTFKIEEERRQAHADRVATLAAAKSKGAGGGGDEAKVAGIALDNARAVLRGFDKYDGFASPVGWSYWIRQGWDNINGNEQAAIRLKIAKMKVDSTLARVAQTKGAISEKEMDIFMSDQPSWTSDEKVWRDWIDSYIAALTTMHTNLSTGQTPYKNGGGGGSTVTVINGMKLTETTPKTAK